MYLCQPAYEQRRARACVARHDGMAHGSIVLIWREREATGGVGLAHLGTPAKTLLEIDGMWIARAGT